MPIEFVSGDLFANTYGVEAFAHGCNCEGSMGAGIAKGFRERYPEMYEQYRARCKAEPRQFNLGDAWLWRAEGQPSVLTLGTQERFWHARASYEAVEQSLTNMRELADTEGIRSIAIPRIGVGYGGLSWRKVRAIVERVFADWAGRLVVYQEYASEKSGQEAEPEAATDRGSVHPSRGSASRKPMVSGAGRGQAGGRSQRRRLSFQVKALTIACTDHRRSERFYREVLGAVPLPTDDPGYGCVWLRLGTLPITLMPNAAEPSPASFPIHAMPILWLEVDDLKAATHQFAKQGVEVVTPSDGQFMQIADPDGLIIEVWQAERVA